MTFVEFFDKVSLENICTCLTCVPDRVILVGDCEKKLIKHIEDYKRIFSDRGHNIEFVHKNINKNSFENIVKVITEIVEEYDDCVFDITGGEERTILALGEVCGKNPEKNIQVHKYNIRTDKIIDCDRDGKTVYTEVPRLTIEENIRIYGGDIPYGDIDEEKTYRWDLNPEFLRDIESMWELCKGNVRYWNMQMGNFALIEEEGIVSEDGLTAYISKEKFTAALSKRKLKNKTAKGIIKELLKRGLLTFYDESDGNITVSYKDKQVKKCLVKAGQILEMKIYTAARTIEDTEGNLLYDDVMNGVVIDWDGDFHDEKTENKYDTENEIDIMLMYKAIPVFVSCKSGDIFSEELYKLNTVAERFGGKYAKKVLIATSLTENEHDKYLRQRIIDMGINLVENVQDMSDTKLQKRLATLWSS